MTTTLRAAECKDLDQLLPLMAALYAEDGSVPFTAAQHRRAAEQLLATPGSGKIVVVEANHALVGYAVVTWGFSFEYGGFDAFLDEMYVAVNYRGQGLAQKMLAAVEDACHEKGVQALHLEVERANLNAQRLYRKAGFVDHDRYLFTKSLRAAP